MSGQNDRPSRLPYTIAVFALFALVVAAWFGQDRIQRIGPGVPAPNFTATTLDGEPRNLEDVRGKVVLLNIWATWCQPCVEEMPAIQRLEDAIEDEDFQVVAVSVDARAGDTDEFGRPGGDIRAFLEEHDIDFTVWHDPSGDIQDLFRTTGVPETFFVDRDGTILRRVVGPAEYDSQAYEDLVRRMLGEGVTARPPTSPFTFDLHATEGAARAGTFHTPHGPVETPVFMPVGTLGTVKAMAPHELRDLGASMILANTYHLYLRPGHELVRELGGLHDFMRWEGPILTDSGGYQVFSLGRINDVLDDGVVFQNHVDGSTHHFTPEFVVDVERTLGADVIMAFDECPPGGCSREEAEGANRRTLAWLERCRDRFDELEARGEIGGFPVEPQALIPVVQGNVFDDLRLEHVRRFSELGDWSGWAIGGLSVGESKKDMWRVLETLHPELPDDRPRYLMGVGYPDDLLEAIGRGCDMFDCVAPTRNARHGTAWTVAEGQINLKGARFKADTDPIDPGCDCWACAHFDRAYVRHLLSCGEILGHRLVSTHNLRFLVRLAEAARSHVLAGDFTSWSCGWLERYHSKGV